MTVEDMTIRLEALPDGGVAFLAGDYYAERVGDRYWLRSGSGGSPSVHRTARRAAEMAFRLASRQKGERL